MFIDSDRKVISVCQRDRFSATCRAGLFQGTGTMISTQKIHLLQLAILKLDNQQALEAIRIFSKVTSNPPVGEFGETARMRTEIDVR